MKLRRKQKVRFKRRHPTTEPWEPVVDVELESAGVVSTFKHPYGYVYMNEHGWSFVALAYTVDEEDDAHAHFAKLLKMWSEDSKWRKYTRFVNLNRSTLRS